MAKYQVKRGDTLPQIATKFKTTVSRLKELNKVYSVSRGQEIEVPSPPRLGGTAGGGMTPPTVGFGLPAFGFNVPTNIPTPFGTFQTPGASVNIPGTTIRTPIPQPALQAANAFRQAGNVASGMMTLPGQLPGMALNAAGQMLQGAGFGFTPNIDPRSGQRVNNNVLGSMIDPRQALMNQYAGRSSSYSATAQQGLTPSQAQNLPSVYTPPAQAMTPQRPQGTYTGNPQGNANDAAWVNYWNWQAANPSQVTPQAPQVMTKSQIWEMKKRARVAKREQEQQEGGGGYQNQYTPFFTGNNVANLALRAR